jgi:hypothetical protein
VVDAPLSKALYGVRSYSLTNLLNSTDQGAFEVAKDYLTYYYEPELRVQSITVDLSNLTIEQKLEVLGLEIDSLITVSFTPNGVGDPKVAARKEFESFTRLDASDVNTFLMDQTVQSFADSTARASAITTPVEGMVTYLNDIDTLSVYNGTAFTTDRTIQVFAGTAARGSAIPSPVEGMYTHINETDSLEYYDGSAWEGVGGGGGASGFTFISSTPFTSTTTLDVDNVFTTDYDAYKIILGVTSSTVSDGTFQLRVSGTTATSDYNYTSYGAQNSLFTNRQSSQASAGIFRVASNGSIAEIIINNPFLASTSWGLANSYDSDGYAITNGFNHTTATSYTGFRLNLNNTTGTVRVYGLGK